MNVPNMSLKDLKIDPSWTLFLDRDGVINQRIPKDYVRNWDQFKFLPGVLDALVVFAELFGKILIVTNQQGIGKGFYTTKDLNLIHLNMTREVIQHGGRIDKVYYCPELAADEPACRKPNIGMGIEAMADFPEIQIGKCLIAGDSASDIVFGNRLNMRTVQIGNREMVGAKVDYQFSDLAAFAAELK